MSQNTANTNTVGAYENLENRFRRWSALRDAAGMLHWDMSAMMPEGGHSARAEQLAALGVVSHQLLTEPKTGELLETAHEEAKGLDPWQRANLHEMRRVHVHATALNSDLVEAMSKAATACEAVWRQARPAGDFGMVKPHLEAIIRLVREAAQAKAEKLGLTPYEALMDEYEPGSRIADIDAVFADYAAFLPDFLGAVLERQASAPAPIEPKGPFPVE